MADNYLEYAREDYERRKAAWLKNKKTFPKRQPKVNIEKPDDESL